MYFVVSEEKSETLADASLPGDQRSGCFVRDVGSDVYHDLCWQRDVYERVLLPSRGVEAIWLIQWLRRHRDGCGKVASLDQALRLSESKSRSLINLLRGPNNGDLRIDRALSENPSRNSSPTFLSLEARNLRLSFDHANLLEA